jgi:3-hydroxybutyryl-CoA dehydratase
LQNIDSIKKFNLNDIYTSSFDITEELVADFARISNDYNPLHTQNSYAVSKGFKEAIVYGNILGTFISYFVGMKLPTEEVMLIQQKTDYKKPIYSGDKLDLFVTVTKIVESVSTVELKFEFKNINKVCVAKSKCLIKCL